CEYGADAGGSRLDHPGEPGWRPARSRQARLGEQRRIIPRRIEIDADDAGAGHRLECVLGFPWQLPGDRKPAWEPAAIGVEADANLDRVPGLEGIKAAVRYVGQHIRRAREDLHQGIAGPHYTALADVQITDHAIDRRIDHAIAVGFAQAFNGLFGRGD